MPLRILLSFVHPGDKLLQLALHMKIFKLNFIKNSHKILHVYCAVQRAVGTQDCVGDCWRGFMSFQEVKIRKLNCSSTTVLAFLDLSTDLLSTSKDTDQDKDCWSFYICTHWLNKKDEGCSLKWRRTLAAVTEKKWKIKNRIRFQSVFSVIVSINTWNTIACSNAWSNLKDI